MGLRHRQYLVEGVQFHPESFMTELGKDLLRNFLQLGHREAKPLLKTSSPSPSQGEGD